MKRFLYLLTILIFVTCTTLLAADGKPYYRQPAISSDGSIIAFVYADDIYTVPATGGEARLVISHAANDYNPGLSPDGKWLAFSSSRTGGGDVYILNLSSGDLRRLTYYSGGDNVECWSPDSTWVYFSSGRHNVGGYDIYKVSIDGGQPVPVVREDYEQQYNGAVSPDGTLIAFNTNDRVRQWWRKGPNINDATNIWIKSNTSADEDFKQFTTNKGKDSWPMWAPDGSGLYFVSYEGTDNADENLYFKSMDGNRRKLTSFTTGRVLWPDIAMKTGDIVFERDFGIWLLKSGGQAAAVNINVIADEKQNPVSAHSYTNNVSEFFLSPDNNKVAFIVHGELFVAPAKKAKDDPVPTAFQVTHTPSRERNIAWDKDSNKLLYTSFRHGNPDLFIYDFITREEKRLTSTEEPEGLPLLSPDGKWCAYYRGMKEIRVINMEDMSDKVLATGFFFNQVLYGRSDLTWSPDSKWLAFVNKDENYFENIFAKKVEDGENALQVTYLPNISLYTPVWSTDGKFMVFGTTQYRNENYIVRVDLVEIDPKFQEDEFDELFKAPKKKEDKETDKAKEEKAEAKPEEKDKKKDEKKTEVTIDLDGIADRVSRMAGFASNAFLAGLTPDDKKLLFVNRGTGQTTLWSVSADPDQVGTAKQLLTSRSGIDSIQFTKNGETMWLTDGSMIKTMSVAGGSAKPFGTKAEMEIDFHKEKKHVFREAWIALRDNFYDGNFNGQDWNQVYNNFQPYIDGARSNYDVAGIMNLMLGDLNASHLGASYFGGGSNVPTGDLGITFDPSAYLENGTFKVEDIVPNGAIAREKSGVKIGDVVTAINGTKLDKSSNLSEILGRTIGKRVKLSYTSGSESKELSVKPLSHGATNGQRYTRWVADNASYVDKISNGRLGYVHIRAMGYGNLEKFKVDLNSQLHNKEGVVIDVRYNNGGHVAPFVIDVLQRKTTLKSYFRGKPLGNSSNLAGNRILDIPTIVLQNERSLSNAEMFAESYRRMNLGKIVGSGSNGWVIWTWGTGLLNGGYLRLPRVKVATVDGEDLDKFAREPDVFVERPLGEGRTGKDTQLDVSVSELLKQIDGSK